jgi:hypothetical protein
MQALLSKLPAFALPFVTRSLRGGRGRRYLIFSLVIAALTGVVGLWLALGSGNFEQGLRAEFGLEEHEFIRERREFTVYVHSQDALHRAERERRHIADELARSGFPTTREYGEVSAIVDWGRSALERASRSTAYMPEQIELRNQARAVTGIYIEDTMMTFAWNDPTEVEGLRAAIARRGLPAIEMYESPLGIRDALRITGFFAGILLAAFATVFAPLLVAVQQAQERHENTLMPLTGTALSPRELAVGLAVGPVSVISIFAIPQLAIFLICSTFAGEVLVAGALLAALFATSVLFIFGAQLLGHLFGHRRTPGVIGIALMAVTGVAWLVGAAFVADGENSTAGFAAVFPHIGLSALLAEVFIEIHSSFGWVFVATFVWTCGAVVLAWLAMTALSRKIEGSDGALLTRAHALIGALTCIALVNVAIPHEGYQAEALRQYVGLGILALPFFALFLTRVPTTDGPPRMRKVPVGKLLLEFASWGVAHIVVVGVLFGLDLQAMHPIALSWLGWCVLVLGLIAIRIVATPGKVAANVWAGFCAFSLVLGFAQSVYWGVEGRHRDLEDVFVMMQLSPVLGLIQIALTVWIPVSLIRHLRSNLGSIR